MACVAVLGAALILSSPTPVTSSPSAAMTPRTVLAEDFAATWCQFCPGNTGALERLQQAVGTDKLVVLAYHVSGSRFDALDSNARLVYYNFPPMPTVIINGLFRIEHGSTNPNEMRLDQQFNAFYQMSSQRLSPLQIALTGGIVMQDASSYRADVTAVVTATAPITGQPRVRFALFENDIDFRADNGETHFDWVVRDMLDEASLTITQPGQQETFKRTVVLNPNWNRQHLGLAVFVQIDAPTTEVLQAAQIQFQSM
jgi:thiol-disulfide isomerase/thioredoxin